jgi:hypothetical protein
MPSKPTKAKEVWSGRPASGRPARQNYQARLVLVSDDDEGSPFFVVERLHYDVMGVQSWQREPSPWDEEASLVWLETVEAALFWLVTGSDFSGAPPAATKKGATDGRSEEHTSELQSLS